MPKRSPGCFNCRKRKVRCDETRPLCNRCVTHGVKCLGYRAERAGGIEFEDQSEQVALRAKQVYKRTAAAEKRSSTTPTNTSSSSDRSGSSTADQQTPAGISTSEVDVFNAGTCASVDTGQALALTSTMSSDNLPQLAQPLHSPTATRNALYQTFLNIYVPQNCNLNGDHFSFFQKIFSLTAPPHPALLAGLDALSLSQIGSVHKDQYLLNSARMSYGTALNALHRSLARIKSDQAVRDDNVLAAVTVLTICEYYDGLKDPKGEGWGRHVHGLEGLLEARKPEALQTDLSLLLFSNARHGSLCHALITRRSLGFARQEWREVAFRCPIVDQNTYFYDIAIRLPGSLERHDRVAAEVEAYEDSMMELGESQRNDELESLLCRKIDEVQLDCVLLEREFRQWHSNWIVREDGQPRYTIEPIDHFPTFTQLVNDRTFDYAYAFSSFTIGYLYSLYWQCMHQLRVNVRSLCALRTRVETSSWAADISDMQSCGTPTDEELTDYVFDLCQCMPFFCEPISAATGSIGIFLPLRTAALWFRDHAMWKHLMWIGQVKEKCFVKGLAPPALDSGTPTQRVWKTARSPPGLAT